MLKMPNIRASGGYQNHCNHIKSSLDSAVFVILTIFGLAKFLKIYQLVF